MKKSTYKTLSKKEKYKLDKHLEENMTDKKDKRKFIKNFISILFGNAPEMK